MKRVLLLAVIGAVVFFALVAGGRWALYGRFFQKTDNAYVKADTVVVSAKTPGRIEDVLVEENALVRRGDALVRIEPDDYAARVRQATADYEARRAALDTVAKEIALNQSKIADARATVKSAEAAFNLVEADYKRTAELVTGGVATRQALDERTSALKAGKARLDSAAAGLAAAEAEGAVIEARHKEARAALAWGKAALELAEIAAGDAVLRAETDGVVGNVSVRAGEYASTGRRLMALVPIQDAYVVANFKETQLAQIRPGEKVRIKIDAYPEADIEGVVDSLSPSSGAEFSLLPPENATGNFTKIVQRVPVKIRLVDAPAGIALLPGLSVTASIDTRTGDPKTTSLFSPRRSQDELAAGVR
ncbi:MAG: HlyD family secretion protein [Amphiplicatus sp.]